MSKMKRAIYPGTFDPVTKGHLDILKRASEQFDEIIVALSENTSKQTLFTLSERLGFLRASIEKETYSCPVSVESFGGLLVSYARKKEAQTLIRGLRAISDFEYEFQMALMNRHLAAEIETVFLMPDEKYVYLSSSISKVVSKLGGDLSAFLPSAVVKALKEKRIVS